MKKVIAVLLSLSLFALTLTACGPKSASGGDAYASGSNATSASAGNASAGNAG